MSGCVEFDGRYHTGPFAIRGEFAQVFIDGADELNDLLQRTAGVNPNIARQMRGFYIEPSLRPLPKLRYDIAAFVRYENFDTQFRMPAGVLPLKQFDRAAWVVGASYFPDPDVVAEDRLLGDPEPELAVQQRRQPEHRARLVVLMASNRLRPRQLARRRRASRDARRAVRLLAGSHGRADDRRAVHVHAVPDQGQARNRDRVPPAERRHQPWLPHRRFRRERDHSEARPR